MDTQTRHALKGDKFAQATKTSVTWLSGHRSNVMRWAISAGVVLVLGVGLLVFWNMREAAAETALGAALDTYSAPLALPGAPPQKGAYATAAERSKAANQQFQAVADKYGWLPEGGKGRAISPASRTRNWARTVAAEIELKKVADSWNRNLANLAKIALASIYHQTGPRPAGDRPLQRDHRQAFRDGYGGAAQLDLADLYAATGKQDAGAGIVGQAEGFRQGRRGGFHRGAEAFRQAVERCELKGLRRARSSGRRKVWSS